MVYGTHCGKHAEGSNTPSGKGHEAMAGKDELLSWAIAAGRLGRNRSWNSQTSLWRSYIVTIAMDSHILCSNFT